MTITFHDAAKAHASLRSALSAVQVHRHKGVAQIVHFFSTMRSHGFGLDVGAVGAHDSLLFQKTLWCDLSESAAKFLFELRISPFGAAISKRSRCEKVQGDVRSPVQPHTMRQVVNDPAGTLRSAKRCKTQDAHKSWTTQENSVENMCTPSTSTSVVPEQQSALQQQTRNESSPTTGALRSDHFNEGHQSKSTENTLLAMERMKACWRKHCASQNN